MIERLWINNEYIPLSKSINPSLTKNITDIQNPDQRKATYSKSTRVPNSKEAANVFGHIFEINLTDLSFNPNVKADIRYEVDGEQILEGYCQLKKIIQIHNKDIEYEIVMFGTIANIFRDMGEKYIDDADMVADLDEWNHPFSKDIQQRSWATEVWNNDSSSFVPFALGTGYVYPLIDYGLVTNLVDFPYYYLPCALYAKEYVDAIFNSNGYTYTSSFFDSTYFKSLIIPSSPNSFQLTSSEITNLQFSANTPIFASTGTSTSNLITAGPTFTAVDTIEFSNELADPSGVYDPLTGEYTVTVSTAGTYDINALIDVNAQFNPIGGASVVTTSDIQGALYVYLNGNQQIGIPFYITYGDFDTLTYSTGSRSTATSPTYPSARVDYLDPASLRFSQVNDPNAANNIERAGIDGVPDRYLLTLNNVLLASGDTITIRWKARYQGLNGDNTKCFRDVGGVFYPGTANVIISVGAFYNKVLNQFPAENATLKIEKIIPDNIKQKDFFMSLVKMFNLWVDTDPNNPRNYLIEPRDSFLGADLIECQEKLAQDRDFELVPMGKLDVAEYYFSYKPDKDFLNEKYTADWQDRIYGDRYINNTNDFVTSEKKTEVIFSPTPLSAPPNKTRVLSTIIGIDDLGQAKDTDHNIRILYYGGLKPGELWNHIRYTSVFQVPDPTPYTTYPYAGHVDDPFTWTEDINFGLVNEVYYDDNVNTITVTNNNLVNKYYGQMLQAYTAEESKIFTGYFNVTPSDFREWTFDKLYHFENAFWRLHKIEGYNPTSEELTKCTFLFLKDVPAFTAGSQVADGAPSELDPGLGGGSGSFGETVPTKGTKTAYNPDDNNYSKRGVDIQGEGNLVQPSAEFIKIQGDGNIVNGEAKDVVINGDNNVIEPGVRNVTLINTSGVTVEESNVTYINGVKLTPGSIQSTDVEEVSVNTTYDPTVKAYVVDTSGGDVTITFDPTSFTYPEGAVYYIKKESNANELFVNGGGSTIDGETSITIKKDNTTMAVISDGTNFKIV